MIIEITQKYDENSSLIETNKTNLFLEELEHKYQIYETNMNRKYKEISYFSRL